MIGSRANSAARNTRGALSSALPNAGVSDVPLAMEQIARALATAKMDRETSLSAAITDLGGWAEASEVFLVTASTAVEVAHCVSQWRTNAQVAVALVNNAANCERESYEAQAVRLREAGARVVQVGFADTSGKGRAAALRCALHELLQRHPTGGAAMSTASTRASELEVEWAR